MTFKAMKNKSNQGQAILLAALLLGGATSCFDDSYDLNKDIDMTINVGGENLAFPVGNTEKVTLDKIIEIEEGDDLQTDASGAYHLLKSGEIDDVNTRVEPVTVQATDTEIDPIEVANESDFEAGSLETLIENKYQEGDIEIKAKEIDEAMKVIYQLFPATKYTAIKIKLAQGGNLKLEKLDATITLTFPYMLQIKGANEQNQITFPLQETSFNEDGSYTYTAYLTGILFDDKTKGKGYKIENNCIDITEQVKVNVNGSVSIKEIKSGESLTLIPTISIDEMKVTAVSGIINPTLDESTSSMELTGLPDFLENDETKLDIANPIFTFHANNPLNTPVEITGILSGSKNGQPIEGSEVAIGSGATDPIILQPGDNTIALSRLGEGGPDEAIKIEVKDINDLIQTIPDVVNVSIQPSVNSQEYYTVDLDKTYTVACDYDIDIPLAFGANLNIVYEETIEDLGGDLEDVDFSKAVLSASVDNTIPLALTLPDENVEVLDANGQKIEGIQVKVTGNIAAGNGTDQPVTSKLDIQLETTQPGTLNQLDAIKLKIVAASGGKEGIQLYDTQWLQLKDIKLKVPNGVKVDLN